MGSKYRLIPHLARAFTELGGATALDAFSGSGVVSYLLKTCGYQVTANDFLAFPAMIAQATVVNQDVTLGADDIAEICGPPADGRDFIQRTFGGIYFTDADLRFLDSAWSHIDRMSGHRQALAISALVLSAARRQPRGVFTVTGHRYDDGRRDLRLSLREHFAERAAEYNGVVFDSGRSCAATSCDVFDLPPARLRRGLPGPALCAAARRQLLHQALPLPGGAVGLLARPGAAGEHAHPEAAQALHAVLLHPHGHRCPAPDGRAVRRFRPRAFLLLQRRAGRRDHRRDPARGQTARGGADDRPHLCVRHAPGGPPAHRSRVSVHRPRSPGSRH